MTQPTDGIQPDQPDQTGPDATQAIPTDATQTFPMQPGPPAPATPPAAAAPEAGVPLADDPSSSGGSGGGRKGLLIGGIAAAVVLAGVGIFAAARLNGSGARPADVLPSDTYAYFQVDIDPSAGQKVAAVRFLEKIPQVKDLQSGDARKKLWELAVEKSDDACTKQFDYDKDIAPWLGDRVGVGLRPGGDGDEPNAVVAVQVGDEEAATTTVTKLMACGDGADDMEVKTRDGFLLFTDKGQGDATLAAVDKGTLAQNATFKEDMSALGEQGIMSAWVDLEPTIKNVSNVAGDPMGVTEAPKDVKGRVVAALRFDPGFIEVAGLARGVEGAQALKQVAGDGTELANLPDDTVAAMHVSGAEQIIDAVWPQLKKSIEDAAGAQGQDDILATIEDEVGIKLPDDLKAVLGRSFTLALPNQEFSDAGVPAIGAKVVSSNAKRADEVFGILEEMGGGAGLLTRQLEGERLYVATTPDYAAKLKSGGKLGETDAFKTAIGDAQNANYAVYVDLDKVEKLYLDQLDGDGRTAVEAMRAVGLSSSATGGGEGSFAFRVVAN